MKSACVLALALCGSCSLITPYPAGVAETGDTACHDTVDNDFDGAADCRDSGCAEACAEQGAERCSNGRDDDQNQLTDCDDPSCAGHCPETTLAACANGRDDDADGRIDAEDATCWPVLDVSIERCATVIGGELWVSATDWVGTGASVSDPTGHVSGAVRMLDGRPMNGTVPLILPYEASREYVSGELDGLTFDASVYTGVDGVAYAGGVPSGVRSGVRIGLGISGFEGTYTETLAVSVVPGARITATWTAHGLNGPFVNGPMVPAGPAWFDVSIRVSGRTATVAVSTGGAPLGEPLSIELGPSFPAFGPLRVIAEGHNTFLGEQPALLGTVHVHREPHVRCGAPAPPFGVGVLPIAANYRPLAFTALSDLTRGPAGEMCAIGTTYHDIGTGFTVAVYAYHSADDGLHWSRSGEFGRAPTNTNGPVGAITYDPVERSYFAAFALWGQTIAGAPAPQRVFVADSTDCVHWSTPRDSGIDLSDGGRFVALGINQYRVTPSGHELAALAFTSSSDPTQSGLVTLRSPWGYPDSWVFDEALDVSLWSAYPPPVGTGSALVPRVTGIGADQVAMVNGWDDDLRAFVRSPGGDWVPAPGLRLAASAEPRSFDAYAVGVGTLVEDAHDPSAWTGRVFYYGFYDGISYGWGWANVRVGASR